MVAQCAIFSRYHHSLDSLLGTQYQLLWRVEERQVFNGVDKFVGGLSSSFQLVSRTSVSAAASSTDIPIDSTKQYLLD